MREELTDYVLNFIPMAKQQANPNIQNNNGTTALYIASQNGRYQVVELLLDHEANPNVREKDDRTALMIAIIIMWWNCYLNNKPILIFKTIMKKQPCT